MPIRSAMIRVSTRGFSDTHDLTPAIRRAVAASGLQDGIATVFVSGSTAGLTTIEFEDGAVDDLKQAIERIAPQNIGYRHDSRWGDGNGFAHVRAALLGPSVSIPLVNGELALGTWQQVILMDFDNRPRTREIRLQIVGE